MEAARFTRAIIRTFRKKLQAGLSASVAALICLSLLACGPATDLSAERAANAVAMSAETGSDEAIDSDALSPLYDPKSSTPSAAEASQLNPDKEHSDWARPSATETPTPGPTLTRALPSATPTPGTSSPAGTPAATTNPVLSGSGAPADFEELPLSALCADAQTFLDQRTGRAGVAVIVPERQTIYTSNGDQLMSMASVVKVAIMVTLLDQAIQEDRSLTATELELLHPMITKSDNDATIELWESIGGGAAIDTYMRSIGIPGIELNPSDSWGASRASARAVAHLFARLAFGEILDEPMRAIAIELLTDVVHWQRWGITAGVPDEVPVGTVVGLKAGWYPAGYGWWVNSAGMFVPSESSPDHPAYVIAVLTRGQPTLEYGIRTIEDVSSRVHSALHCQGTSACDTSRSSASQGERQWEWDAANPGHSNNRDLSR